MKTPPKTSALNQILEKSRTCPKCNIKGNIHIGNIETGESTDFCMFCGRNEHTEIAIDKHKEYLVKYAEHFLWNGMLEESLELLYQLNDDNTEKLDKISKNLDESNILDFIDNILNNKKYTIPEFDENGHLMYEKKCYGGYGIIHFTNDIKSSVDPTNPDNFCLDGKFCVRDNDKSRTMRNDENVSTYHLFGNHISGTTSLIQLIDNTIVHSIPLSTDNDYNEIMHQEMEKMQEKGVKAISFVKSKNDIIEV
ncbi:MAG: hypothetical protein ACLFMM_05990 [Methanohalobium sp.]|uniref:hypothetical protein n=1 Tax=Methanohalobium sp. TaxID=2837493 RepID=UPI0039799D72